MSGRLASLAATALTLLVAGPFADDSVVVTASPVALDPETPERGTVGALAYRGGLALRSSDPRFGGLSDVRVSADGRSLVAIGDEGIWFAAELEYDARGFLSGLSNARLGPLLGLDGKPLQGKRQRDAESMAVLEDGSIVVGFEQRHRLWRYPAGFAGTPEPVTPPPGLDKADRNAGLEALALLPDGRFLALLENALRSEGIHGWVREGDEWSALSYVESGALRPTAAAALPNGDVLVAERSFSLIEGLHVRVRLVPGAQIKPGSALAGRVLAEFRPPLTVDNLEGIAVRASRQGETLVYLLSDDNFNPLQRTLLLMFALSEEAGGRSHP